MHGKEAVAHDDVLKRIRGIDTDRCDNAYDACNGDVAALQEVFSYSYLTPTGNEIAAKASEIQEFLQSGQVGVVVPMRERGDVVRSVFEGLTTQVPADHIVVVDDGSDDQALSEVRQYPDISLIYRDDILGLLDWDRLLPILNLKEIPRGKGLTVMAGYLYHFLRAHYSNIRPRWIFQNDAEIAEYHRYQCLDHLVYGMVTNPDRRYFKMAKFGRTNERCMTARSMLHVLVDSPAVSRKIRTRAHQLFIRLVRHKWMLTGEFLLSSDLATRRPFATGYLEETLTSMFMEDIAASDEKGRDIIIQMANPNPRLDAANDDRKESIMQQQISNFLLAMALWAKPTDKWSLKDISELNQGPMSKPIRMGWIPPNDGPVVAEVVRNDRIIPSINQLFEGGFVDEVAAKRLVS